mmetsp:Transcript_23180/g.41880  ORF Transcript_23180/g.41880 Transcript_23180/m.41880 type:complete len:181 (+) Transcript_23180:131-673(+)
MSLRFLLEVHGVPRCQVGDHVLIAGDMVENAKLPADGQQSLPSSAARASTKRTDRPEGARRYFPLGSSRTSSMEDRAEDSRLPPTASSSGTDWSQEVWRSFPPGASRTDTIDSDMGGAQGPPRGTRGMATKEPKDSVKEKSSAFRASEGELIKSFCHGCGAKLTGCESQRFCVACGTAIE